MKLALNCGVIRVREMTDFQYRALRDSGRLKWDKNLKELSGQASLEVLEILANMVPKLPEPVEAYRQHLKKKQEAVDVLRLTEKPELLLEPQLKEGIKPFEHQKRGYDMAMVVFELVEPDAVLQINNKEKEGGANDSADK